MHKVAINKLSFSMLFPNSELLSGVLSDLVATLDMMLRAIKHERVRLFVDPEIDNLIVIGPDQSLAHWLGRCADRDLVRKWYLYSRNHAASLCGDTVETSVSLERTFAANVTGNVCSEAVDESVKWLSVGFSMFVASSLFLKTEFDQAPKEVENAFSVQSARLWWPIFEPSPKHRREGYHNSKGEYVSPMPLNDFQAQEALDTSVEVSEERFSEYNGNNFRFLKTYPDKNIFHGFLIVEG